MVELYIFDYVLFELKEVDSYWMGGLWDNYLVSVVKWCKLDLVMLCSDID